MQENPKFTLEFLDRSLRNLSNFAFDIDKESKAILGIIASHGPITETKIASLGKRRTILSRDIIRRRLLVSDLSSDFLSIKKGKKIGNLKGKREKFYSLTFKGFLASLYETPIQENFWIKNYIKMIEKVTDDATANTLLDHIYFSIGSFLILHSNKRGLLTQYSDPEDDFYENYDFFGSLGNMIMDTSTVRIPSAYQEMFAHCVVQFFISCEVIGSLVKDSVPKKIKKQYEDEEFEYFDDFLDTFFRSWMTTMFFALNKTPEQILKQSEKDDYYDDEDEDFSFENILGDEPHDNIRFMAEDEYRRIKPKGGMSDESLLRR